MEKRSFRTPKKSEEVYDKIADQTYWVNQIKENPELFEQYMNGRVLKSNPMKNMFNSTNAENAYGTK
jgi:hypothetical protein